VAVTEAFLPTVLAGIIVAALNAYVLLGGADFGGGVWDLLASGPRRAEQRELIAHAIGPVWEANHVWLILAVVLLFTCFAPAFADLAITLHIPLTLMLVGIVLRGSAFTFRSYDREHDVRQERWGRVFAIASVVTPVLLGVSVGTVAAGRVGSPRTGRFIADFVMPWLTPFAWSIGLYTLLLFAFLAAVYLTVEANDPALREDFRRRALGAGGLLFIAALLTLALSAGAPLMRSGLLGEPRAILLHVATGIAATTALLALWTRRYLAARIAAAVQVSAILWGWALAQYPYLLPPHLTIDEAASPAITLRLVLRALVLGGVVLFPSLLYLFRVFKAATERR
jgi:cytochrome d ubiquinol oxidase subunit II